MELKLLGRVCKLGLAGGRTGFSPVRHTMRLAEDPSNQLRSRTRAGPSHRSGSLQTHPRPNLSRSERPLFGEALAVTPFGRHGPLVRRESLDKLVGHLLWGLV